MAGGFPSRHIGPRPNEVAAMLQVVGAHSLEDLVNRAVPASVRTSFAEWPAIGPGLSEREALAELSGLADQNVRARSFIGAGYSNSFTPPVIQRNLLEDPRWYTPYTPYQAEVAQGRLEALLNFQTMISDLTGMEISNASLLDEATAAAEAMAMCMHLDSHSDRRAFFVSSQTHPQVVDVLQTRAAPLGIKLIISDHMAPLPTDAFFGALLPYPCTDGRVDDLAGVIAELHHRGALAVVDADLLGLTLLTSPGEMGADIVVGTSQRFGVPLFYGGPHAAYIACRDSFKRQLPGRLVGVSRDSEGRAAYRLALQTREQHIRRERATSNICTAQVLLAVTASMYACWHGPEGLQKIALHAHSLAAKFAGTLHAAGFRIAHDRFFDTVRVDLDKETSEQVISRGHLRGINLRHYEHGSITVAFDETSSDADIVAIAEVFGESGRNEARPPQDVGVRTLGSLGRHRSVGEFLTHPVFHKHRSETQMMRYLNQLSSKDIGLANSMIPLGSCTMKLNAAAEMMPISWSGFSGIHPYAPKSQVEGYRELITRLEKMLCEVTGFAAVSMQPNSGAQGEYAGMMVIRQYHIDRHEPHRNICLIPQSAHGTNPASAVLAGMRVVVVKTDSTGNIDSEDLKARATEHATDLAALMMTYPSTHGVFEEGIPAICEVIHQCGGQVYLDGANMNAQVGLCAPARYGADVCHLNLHKTFCIPHGGGGPGMGPIGVAAHLAPFLPGHTAVSTGGDKAIGAVAAAPWGSPGILPIPYAYMRMMGREGLRRATMMALLNANYIAAKLRNHFPVLYEGAGGFVAHECILDLRPLKASSGVEVEDVAKRLMDYGFHAPTVSFPVIGTLMVEPTESEDLEELDRFCNAMIAIRSEIRSIEEGRADRRDNPLKNAPHTAESVMATNWSHCYSREEAAFPAEWLRDSKYWPPVARIDGVYGDRNLVCSCPPLDDYSQVQDVETSRSPDDVLGKVLIESNT